MNNNFNYLGIRYLHCIFGKNNLFVIVHSIIIIILYLFYIAQNPYTVQSASQLKCITVIASVKLIRNVKFIINIQFKNYATCSSIDN